MTVHDTAIKVNRDLINMSELTRVIWDSVCANFPSN
jgi:hypothetical protein